MSFSFAPKKPVEEHILMSGDAAGLITPLCGNGMAMAIRSAKILSETRFYHTTKVGNWIDTSSKLATLLPGLNHLQEDCGLVDKRKNCLVQIFHLKLVFRS